MQAAIIVELVDVVHVHESVPNPRTEGSPLSGSVCWLEWFDGSRARFAGMHDRLKGRFTSGCAIIGP